METKIIKVTPLSAEAILRKSKVNNRKIKDSHVDFLASQMLSGQWIENSGEPLIFNGDGLIDGQHRMLAVIRSNKSFDFLVVTGASEESFAVIDSGIGRTGGDILHINNVIDSSKMFTIIKGWLILKNSGTHGIPGSWSKKLATNQIVLKTYNEDPEYWVQVCRDCNRWYKSYNRLMNISFFAPIYVAINKKAGDQAYRFFELLCNMRFSENRNDPLRKFTNLMVGNASSLKKYKIGTKRALLIKTWNAFYEGKSISALKFADDNEFPSILPK